MLDIAIVAIVCAALAPYALGPILVRLTQRCPDIVDQGTGSVEELARELRRLRTFYCWWD